MLLYHFISNYLYLSFRVKRKNSFHFFESQTISAGINPQNSFLQLSPFPGGETEAHEIIRF